MNDHQFINHNLLAILSFIILCIDIFLSLKLSKHKDIQSSYIKYHREHNLFLISIAKLLILIIFLAGLYLSMPFSKGRIEISIIVFGVLIIANFFNHLKFFNKANLER